ncbi:MAG: YesL family protein [Clostridiales bacterium]|nr:YesL family protein [Clostridiales bacterium]MBP5417598.1 YesL family protein [Clostridiales bacterium]
MDIFKYDSPLMSFLNTVFDLMFLNILCFICCIPIVTIGPALAAKYDVAMRIVRKEEPTIFRPFFRAFKNNFKQSIIIWSVLLVACFLLYIDWYWIFQNGIGNVSPFYLMAAILTTLIISFIIMTIFPIIARFEVTIREAFKTSLLFSMVYFLGLLSITIISAFSLYLCIKYIRFLPLVVVVSHVIIVFCLCLILVRGFSKLEERFGETDDSEEEKAESSEEAEK